MPLTFECRTTIAAPPERVFAAITDIDSFGSWMRGFVRVERVTPGPLAVGSKFRETRKMMGHEATEEFEVTGIDAPRTLDLYVDGSKGSSKCGWYKFRHTVTPIEGGSLLVLSGEAGGATGCMALLGKVMVGPMKMAIGKDLKSFKAWVETGQPQVS